MAAWKKFIKRISLGLTIAGIILSTLHQGALGALFTYAPGKLHPLWYSGFLWFIFFCSAIPAGLSMVIVVSALCVKFMKWRCDKNFLDNIDDLTLGLSKGCALGLITYLALKMITVAHDNEWAYLLTGWGQYFLFEILVSIIIPLVLYTVAIRNRNVGLSRFTAFITVAGIVFNRINTAYIAFNWQIFQEIPHWKEVMITITIFAIYFATYRFILYRLPILYTWQDQ